MTKLQKQHWRRGGSSIATLTAPKRGCIGIVEHKKSGLCFWDGTEGMADFGNGCYVRNIIG